MPNDTPTPPDPRQKALAALLDKENLAAVDGRTLMQEGVIARVHVSFWRPRTRLDLADLGLPELTDDERATMLRLISLGSKRLLPDAYYRDLFRRQRRIYRTLESFTYTTSWGSFIPLKAFGEWLAAHQVAVDDLLAFRDDLVNSLDAVTADLRTQYAVAARRAWRMLSGESRQETSEDAFVAAFCDRILSDLPSAQEIVSSFRVEVAYNRILPPDGTEASARGGSQDIQSEHRQLLSDVLRSAQQQKEALVSGFLTDLATQLRTLAYDAATDILGALEKPGNWQREGLHPRSMARLKALVEQVNRLNFFGDRDMERMMSQISDYLDQSPKERSTDEIRHTLQRIQTQTRATLLDLGIGVDREELSSESDVQHDRG